jgi:putative Holliday junction resolvase
MGRILAIDYGTKRVGVAVTDPLKLIANPLTTIDTPKIFEFLKQYLQTEMVETFVVGKPLRLDGTDTHGTQPTDVFVKKLQEYFPAIPIVRIDERFTSSMALQTMIDMGTKKKDRQNKKNLDQMSAALILQTYMQMYH